MVTQKEYDTFIRGQDDARDGKPRKNPYCRRSLHDLWEQGYQAELDIVWK